VTARSEPRFDARPGGPACRKAYRVGVMVSVVKIFGPTVFANVGPTWLLGFGLEEGFTVVAAEQEGEPVQVAA
jgi:hypothetical protein